MTMLTKPPAETDRAEMIRNRNKLLADILRRLRREQECEQANTCRDKTEEQETVFRSQFPGRGQRGTGLNHFGH